MYRFSFSVKFIPSILLEVRGLLGDEVERSLLYGFQSIGGGFENDHQEGIVVVLVIRARCFFLSTRPS